jgi:hypothetical protein
MRTWLSLRNDNSTSVKYCLKFIEVDITVSGSRRSASWNDGFLDRQLDDERL